METTEHTITLEGRTIMYDVTGAGPPIVFVHGVWATGGLWYKVIERLGNRFRCINIHLPLGVHRYPSPPDVDHSPAALARVIAGLIIALDLRDVTLVGNDTGGALCQLVVSAGAPRVGRLVLTNCDAFEVFPPRRLEPIYAAARVPALWWLMAQVMRAPRVRRRFWGLVAHAAPDHGLLNMLLDRFATQGPIRRDLRLTIRAIDRAQTIAAAREFSSFDRDVLVIWGTDDVFFPIALGRRLASAFPKSTFQPVPNAKLFVAIDQPDIVAKAIADFAGREFAPIPVTGDELALICRDHAHGE
jgi:pimeloyl-ACP methyl ester carboxylesterase